MSYLFRGCLWHEGGDDQVYEALFSEQVEEHEVSMADRTASVLHLIYGCLQVQIQNKKLLHIQSSEYLNTH